MNLRRILSGAALIAGVALPAAALAVPAVTTATVNVRASPNGADIGTFAAGTPVDVEGCNQAYTWCLAHGPRQHGWVYAPYLRYTGQEARHVTLPDVALAVGLPILGAAIAEAFDDDDDVRFHRRVHPRARFGARFHDHRFDGPRFRRFEGPRSRHGARFRDFDFHDEKAFASGRFGDENFRGGGRFGGEKFRGGGGFGGEKFGSGGGFGGGGAGAQMKRDAY
jgi:uncharacterized protein YraI